MMDVFLGLGTGTIKEGPRVAIQFLVSGKAAKRCTTAQETKPSQGFEQGRFITTSSPPKLRPHACFWMGQERRGCACKARSFPLSPQTKIQASGRPTRTKTQEEEQARTSQPSLVSPPGPARPTIPECPSPSGGRACPGSPTRWGCAPAAPSAPSSAAAPGGPVTRRRGRSRRQRSRAPPGWIA